MKPKVICCCSDAAPFLRSHWLRSSLVSTSIIYSCNRWHSSVTYPFKPTSELSQQVSFSSTFCNRWSVDTNNKEFGNEFIKGNGHEQNEAEKERDANIIANNHHFTEPYNLANTENDSKNVEQEQSKESCRIAVETINKLSKPSESFKESASLPSVPLSPEFSYRYLLERGAFASVMQLAHSPFAPSPLRVYRDLLQLLEEAVTNSHSEQPFTSLEWEELFNAQKGTVTSQKVKRKANCSMEGTESAKYKVEGNEREVKSMAQISNVGDELHLLTDNELQVTSMTNWETTRKRVLCALSAPGEVRELMRAAYAEVRNAINELKEMNDVESIEHARNRVSELYNFMEYFHTLMSNSASQIDKTPTCIAPPHHQYCHNDDDDYDFTNSRSNSVAVIKSWEESPLQLIPDSVYADTLHYLLQMCSMTGLHLSAVNALDELIHLSERVQICQEITNTAGSTTTTSSDNNINTGKNNEKTNVFSIDEIVERVQRTMIKQVHLIGAHDHIAAMESCALHKDFMTALSLYRRFMVHATEGRFTLHPVDLERAMIALSHCVQSNSEFDTLRELMLDEEAGSTLPVSVPLYTSLLEVLSNIPHHPNQLTLAFALYRRLRDGRFNLHVNSYAALIGCSVGAYETTNAHCLTRAQQLTWTPYTNNNNSSDTIMWNRSNSLASVPSENADTNVAEYRDPLQSFAFYHEARACCKISDFTAEMYTHLLRAYVHGGFGNDAKQTLSVLMESGAPLSHSSFHTLLSSASITLRDGQEIVESMFQQYKLCPTPITYGWLVLATIREHTRPEASPKLDHTNFILQVFDFHEEAVQCFTTLHPTLAQGKAQTLLESPTTSSSSSRLEKETAVETQRDHVEKQTNRTTTRNESTNAQGASHANDNNNISRAYSCMSASASQDAVLISIYPFYVLSVQNALMHVKGEIYSLHSKRRIAPYLLPLIRIAQMQMNAFTSMPPQMPTQLSLKQKSYQHQNEEQSQQDENESNVTSMQNEHKKRFNNGDDDNVSNGHSNLCVAVLAADALLSLEECVLPFIHFYSAIFIPFSTLLTYQYAIMVKNVLMESNSANYHMSRWLDVCTHASSTDVSHSIDESLYDITKLRSLRRFLQTYKEVIHIGSIDEELELNRVANRYGVSLRDEVESSFGKVAVAAIHLARRDLLLPSSEVCEEEEQQHHPQQHFEETGAPHEFNHTSNENKLTSLCTLYAQHNVSIIAVSNRFHECGRYIVRLKKEYVPKKSRMNKERSHHKYSSRNVNANNDDNAFEGLREVLKRVYYHNPSIYPNWTPPSLNVRSITSSKAQAEHSQEHLWEQEEEEKFLHNEFSEKRNNRTCTNKNNNVKSENVIDVIGSRNAEKMYKALVNNNNSSSSSSCNNISQSNAQNECSSRTKNTDNSENMHCIENILDTEMVSRMMCDE